jgi:hypothetical protein
MSGPVSGGRPARPSGSLPGRVTRAWRGLPPERRLAAGAALLLFLTLFLPWYQETVIASGTPAKLQSASASLTGWGAFSFVEAAVLLVAVAVLVLLFVRAEGKAFHVPGGDGGVITAAGVWTGALIVWRMFDKEGTTGHGQYATTAGIEWGIFIALGVAGLLAYAGTRIKLAHEPEPPLPGETPGAGERPRAERSADQSAPPAEPRRRPRRPRPPTEPAEDRADPTPRPRRAGQRRSDRSLNFSDLDEIEFDEPPEVPQIRRRPSSPDQLTTRVDHPE